MKRRHLIVAERAYIAKHVHALAKANVSSINKRLITHAEYNVYSTLPLFDVKRSFCSRYMKQDILHRRYSDPEKIVF